MDREQLQGTLAANHLPDLESLIDDLNFASCFSRLLDRERSDEQRERMNHLLDVVKELSKLGIYDDVMALWRGSP